MNRKNSQAFSESVLKTSCEVLSPSSPWLFLTIASVLKGEVRAVCSPPKRVRLPRAMELLSKGECRETTIKQTVDEGLLPRDPRVPAIRATSLAVS